MKDRRVNRINRLRFAWEWWKMMEDDGRQRQQLLNKWIKTLRSILHSFLRRMFCFYKERRTTAHVAITLIANAWTRAIFPEPLLLPPPAQQLMYQKRFHSICFLLFIEYLFIFLLFLVGDRVKEDSGYRRTFLLVENLKHQIVEFPLSKSSISSCNFFCQPLVSPSASVLKKTFGSRIFEALSTSMVHTHVSWPEQLNPNLSKS